jgi:hypothetical protein
MNYTETRAKLVASPNELISLEKHYFEVLFQGLQNNAKDIKRDFDASIKLKNFWFRYAPKQRGHKPSGNALPWGEVGEKVLDAYIKL